MTDEIEIRRSESGTLELAVADGASVRVERVDGGEWSICITKGQTQIRIGLTSEDKIEAVTWGSE